MFRFQSELRMVTWICVILLAGTIPAFAQQTQPHSFPDDVLAVPREYAEQIESLEVGMLVDGIAQFEFSRETSITVFSDAIVSSFDEESVALDLPSSELQMARLLLEADQQLTLIAVQDLKVQNDSSDYICEVHLNSQSVHDMIQVFEAPRFDLLNPIGGLSVSLYCDGECPLTNTPIEGVMVMPDSFCDSDQYTCGLWYAVSWVPYEADLTVTGWISAQDEDVRLVGDCSDLPFIDPHSYFSDSEDRSVQLLLEQNSYHVIRQAGFTADHSRFIVLRSRPPAGHSLSSPEFVRVWDTATNNLTHTIEVGRDSVLSDNFEYVFSTNHFVDGHIQAPQLIETVTAMVITQAPIQRNVSHVAITDDASAVLVAFHDFGFPADELWFWSERSDWVEIKQE